MIWKKEKNKKSLSHGFSDHPYLTNSKYTDDAFMSDSYSSYSPELWHYGVKGMHWGEVKEPDKKGSYRVGSTVSQVKQNSKPNGEQSVIKESISKIAQLMSLKRQMQQKMANQLKPKIIRYGNKVVTIKPARRSAKEVASSGANAIQKLPVKPVNDMKDYSGALEQMLKTRKVKGG